VPPLGGNSRANNHFFFARDTDPILLLPDAPGKPDTYVQARRDLNGAVCPLASHIRKVNPRDFVTEEGGEADTLTRLMLRRGIPFGKALDSLLPGTPDPLKGDRGLIFVSYQTSIDRQFSFLTKKWTNDSAAPNAGGGHDPLIGQNAAAGRRRFVELIGSGGEREPVGLDQEWVVPTGGGYFLSPSLAALQAVFAGSPAELQALERELGAADAPAP
jgi:deferrochelatase/peroxidase EfeB